MTEPEFDREVMERAIRRLNILEYVILGAAAVLALVGGAVAAWLLNATLELPFRLSWAVVSLLLFVVPGGIVYARERRADGTMSGGDVESSRGERNGG